jgi:monooxygenase
MEHFDVVVVGAGISGIGAGYFLQRDCPNKSFVILEGRESLGGTWDLFRYPGVRSDSDMHTLGYSFKPWTAEKSIADGPSILSYLNETVDQYALRQKIRFNTLVTAASWSSDTATWTLTATNSATNSAVTYTCNYLYMCSGYYSYKEGFTPHFPGVDTFRGTVVHPQKWPNNLDYAGKKVVVIGSGATAMTLVPAMAASANHVVMLQRSPTYVVSRPDKDSLALTLRKFLPEKVAYSVTRWKNTTLQQFVYKRTRTKPEQVKEALLKGVREALGDNYDVDTHFTPSYNPWDQRLCLVPNGDLFESIKHGKASVVTDHIARFDETGIQLQSGNRIDADIIVTATGLNLVTLGEMSFSVDGQTVDFSQTWSYKGCAYSDVPNLASSFGYINASWTLRADLTCEYVCRLLNHMDKTGTNICTPRLRESDLGMPERPWIDNFSAGYMQRVMHQFPKQGDREPWINPQNYKRDKKMFRDSPIVDGVMAFEKCRQPA